MEHKGEEELLETLINLKTKKFVSGTKLARHFNITRTAVWKKIQRLENLGYRFESKTKVGYKLVGVPDLLHPLEVLSELKTEWFGRPYYYHQELTSTNDKALSLAMESFPEGTLVVAEHQTSGRGRLGRNWMSLSQKGLYFSFILRPAIEPRHTPQLVLLAALTMVETLEHLYSLPVKLKWPNDLVVEGRKIAGLLAEAQMEPQKVRFVVLGIGLNVFHNPEDFKGEFRYLPTSLALEVKKTSTIKRQDILILFGTRFEKNYHLYLEKGFAPWLPRLREKSMLLNKIVTVNIGSKIISGKAVGFSDQGGLIVHLPNNHDEVIWIGDVEHVTTEF